MSTGRICPCQKIDNSQKIANESLWRNPGKSQGGEMLLISVFIEFYFFKIVYTFLITIYFYFSALGIPGWMGLDKSATIAIVMALILLTAALSTAYKLYFCRRNRDLRNDQQRTENTGQYHGNTISSILIFINEYVKLLVLHIPI